MSTKDAREITPGTRSEFQRDTYIVAKAGPNAFEINDDVGPLASLQAFDIRNGKVSDAKSLLVKPTIGAAWHWRPVEGLVPDLAIKHVNAYIRTALVAASTLPNDPYTAAQKIKIGLVVGVARAVMTHTYILETMSFIPGETAPAMLKHVEMATSETRFETTGELTAAQHTTLNQALNITEAERAASRLPAQESVVRATHGYRTLCQTVRPLFEGYGGYMNFVALDHTLTCIDLAPLAPPPTSQT